MTSKRSILLVEDNEDDERLTMRALRKITPAVDIKVARDGQEAIEALTTRPIPYTLVLLDLKLPKLSGIEVLQRIRANEDLAHLIVVMLTSSDEPSDVRACYERYANSYIRKPVDFQDFATVVQQLGIYWLDTNVGPV